MKTVLIGFGDIADKHISVLNELGCEIVGIFTRNPKNYIQKQEKFGISKMFQTLDEVKNASCDFYMILTSSENNCNVLKQLIPKKTPIFVEKPVGFSIKEIDQAIQLNEKFNTPIMVGVNRRFYSIFHKALEFLNKQEIKINFINVDAPERFSDINKTKFNENIKKHWMFSNSIHCVDLIRFFCGDVIDITSYSNKEKFSFNAIGNCKNSSFVYTSNWKSPGNWSITLYAPDIRIVFNPLENGVIYFGDKVLKIEPEQEDIRFKPGFYSQLEVFLDKISNKKELSWPCSDLKDHRKSLELIEKIF